MLLLLGPAPRDVCDMPCDLVLNAETDDDGTTNLLVRCVC